MGGNGRRMGGGWRRIGSPIPPTPNARVQAESLSGRRVVFVAELPALEKYLPPDAEAAGSIAAAENPRAAAAYHTADAALYSSRATAGKLLPQVNLVGQVRHNFDPLATVNRTAWQVSLQLNAPIVDTPTFFDYLQRDQSATATHFKADDTVRQARAQAESLWRQYRGVGAQVRAADVRTRALRRVADTYEKMFEAGLAQLDAVLEKYRMLSIASINLEQLKMQRYGALCQLLALMGKFEPSMLAIAN